MQKGKFTLYEEVALGVQSYFQECDSNEDGLVLGTSDFDFDVNFRGSQEKKTIHADTETPIEIVLKTENFTGILKLSVSISDLSGDIILHGIREGDFRQSKILYIKLQDLKLQTGAYFISLVFYENDARTYIKWMQRHLKIVYRNPSPIASFVELSFNVSSS
jgi:hypothetical protein